MVSQRFDQPTGQVRLTLVGEAHVEDVVALVCARVSSRPCSHAPMMTSPVEPEVEAFGPEAPPIAYDDERRRRDRRRSPDAVPSDFGCPFRFILCRSEPTVI